MIRFTGVGRDRELSFGAHYCFGFVMAGLIGTLHVTDVVLRRRGSFFVGLAGFSHAGARQ